MQLHNLIPQTKRKKSRYIGRGGKRGTTSGRGTKGQKARAGHKIRPEIRDYIKKIPKHKGYRFHGHRDSAFVINLDVISKHFKAGETVNKAALLQKKLLPKFRLLKPVKILGNGASLKKLTFEGVLFSKSARQKIQDEGSIIK